MYNSDTDLLFPPRLIPSLRSLRGPDWQALVDRVMPLDQDDVERMSFVLMMIRLSSCTSCHADSFRALRGCTLCANQSVRRFHGSDDDLLQLYREAREEIEGYLAYEQPDYNDS